MIKRIIFDIDNTLIPWKEEYFEEIKKELDFFNIEYTEKDYNEIKKALSEYENQYYTFDKKLMLGYVNKYTKKKYPENFVHNLTKRWENCVPEQIDKEVIKTLEYLKSKYQMVILTDWFADQQAIRLEKVDLMPYFEHIYSAEKTKRKPFKEAFMQAIEKNKPEECIIIGDDIERDIKGALNAGLKAVYYNPKNKTSNIKNDNYYEISKLEELQQIL